MTLDNNLGGNASCAVITFLTQFLQGEETACLLSLVKMEYDMAEALLHKQQEKIGNSRII